MPLRIAQSRVVAACAEALFLQEGRRLFHLFARGAVDDARFPGVPLKKGGELGVHVFLGLDVVKEVGAVEGGADEQRVAQAEALQDVPLHLGRGRGGEGRHRAAGEPLHKPGQGEVVGPEVVPPLRNAMGLVYREEGEGQGGQRVPEAGDVQAFRRNIEEIERAFAQRRMHGARPAASRELLSAAARRPLAQAAST